MAPSHGTVHIRIPCPDCGWAEKRADRTKLVRLDEDGATFTAVCFDHGTYDTHIDPENDQPYLDLATLYRNLVKERAFGQDTGTLHVMMKGGDWAFGCQLVDGALGALATPAAQMPMRIFTPQVLAPTGAKSTPSRPATSNSPTSARSTRPNAKPSASWPSALSWSPHPDPPDPRSNTSIRGQELNASIGGQEHIRLRSPWAWSIRRTGGQTLTGVRPIG
ncbi:MAG: hypothetical protein ACRDQY_16190 [Pseudonocardiaceae bacterium]